VTDMQRWIFRVQVHRSDRCPVTCLGAPASWV